MEITAEERGGATVVALRGRLDFDTAEAAGARLDEVLARPEGVKGVVLDASELSYVSSAGLRVFMTAARTASGAGVPIALAGLQEPVARVFEISGLSTSRIFEIRDSVQDAVDAVTASPEP